MREPWRDTEDARSDLVRTFLSGKSWTTLAEVLLALGYLPDRQTRSVQIEVGIILKRLGWQVWKGRFRPKSRAGTTFRRTCATRSNMPGGARPKTSSKSTKTRKSGEAAVPGGVSETGGPGIGVPFQPSRPLSNLGRPKGEGGGAKVGTQPGCGYLRSKRSQGTGIMAF